MAKNPIVMVPQIPLFVLTLVSDVANGPSLAGARLVLDVFIVVLGVIMIGTYPPMVKAILEGRAPSLGDALGQAVRSFWALLSAAIVLAILFTVGLIAILVPGVIFITWYAYTVPAIMLDGKGALDGMSASRAFGRDKKANTFSIVLVLVAAGFVAELIELGFSYFSALLGHVVFALLEIPLVAWLFVILSYAYIMYGPSAPATPPSAGQVGPAQPMPPVPPPPAAAAPTRYCSFCGTVLKEDAQFCGSCGRPV